MVEGINSESSRNWRNYCLGCGTRRLNSDGVGTYLQVEHIIPQEAGKKYPNLLKPPKRFDRRMLNIIDSQMNRVPLCTGCHREVDLSDTGKHAVFTKDGLVGLIEFIALYPRSPFPWIREIQFLNWQVLFANVESNLKVLETDHKGAWREEYDETRRMIERYLYYWRKTNEFNVVRVISRDNSNKGLEIHPVSAYPLNLSDC